MTFTLKIDCGTAAFVPSIGDEPARILRRVARDVEGCQAQGGEPRKIFDVNGNCVGTRKLTGR